MASHFKWFIDNGHGNDTSGKRSPKLPDNRQLFEYEFNRDVVAKLVNILKDKDIDYEVVVEEINDISLSERCNRANNFNTAKSKLFVSVHSNAHGNGSEFTSANGIETLYYPNSSKGLALAKVFQEKLTEALGWTDRGCKKRDDLTILKKTHMPAIITETGFYTNLNECKELLKDEIRNKIAQAHADAIVEIDAKGNAFFN